MQQRAAVEQRLETLREQVDGDAAALLDQARAALTRADAAARAGNTADALPAADELVALAKRVKAELTPVEPGKVAEPGKTVELRPFRRFPALEAIGRGELYLMLLWALVLLFPLWSRAVNRWLLHDEREAVRRARRWKFAALLLLPALPLPLWPFGAETATQTSPFKLGLSHGDIVASRVIMPPVAFGLAEINDAEYLRPPTWSASAAISEEGRYVQGAQDVLGGRRSHARGAAPARRGAPRRAGAQLGAAPPAGHGQPRPRRALAPHLGRPRLALGGPGLGRLPRARSASSSARWPATSAAGPTCC